MADRFRHSIRLTPVITQSPDRFLARVVAVRILQQPGSWVNSDRRAMSACRRRLYRARHLERPVELRLEPRLVLAHQHAQITGVIT